MKNRPVFLLLILACLSGGVLIYFSSRSSSLFLNQGMAAFGIGPIFHFIQTFFQHHPFPGWVIYSLPDALWMSSLTMLVLLIWDFKLYNQSIFWLALAFLSGLLFEGLQFFHLIPGTFDVVDVIFLVIGMLVPLSCILIKVRV